MKDEEIAMADGEHKETLRRGNKEENGNNQIQCCNLQENERLNCCMSQVASPIRMA